MMTRWLGPVLTNHRVSTKWLVLRTWAAIAVVLFGCGGGGGGADDENGGNGPIGPPAPPLDVRGVYGVGHRFILVGVGPVFDNPCSGTLEIDSQSGNNFDGELTIDAAGDCEGFGGVTGPISGMVNGNQISFTVSGIEDPLAAVGCEITGGESAFTGTVSSTAIDVSRRIEGRCTFSGQTFEAELDWEIQGSKA